MDHYSDCSNFDMLCSLNQILWFLVNVPSGNSERALYSIGGNFAPGDLIYWSIKSCSATKGVKGFDLFINIFINRVRCDADLESCVPDSQVVYLKVLKEASSNCCDTPRSFNSQPDNLDLELLDSCQPNETTPLPEAGHPHLERPYKHQGQLFDSVIHFR